MMKTIHLPSKIGMFELVPTGNNSISVRCENASVRGVIYRVSLHGTLNGDQWKINENRDNVYIRRPDKKFNHDAPSDSARRVIMDTANEVLTVFVAHNRPAILTAERKRIVQHCQACGQSIVELKKQLLDAEAAWEASKIALEEFDTHTGYGSEWNEVE
jgi:hypothetical protein